MNAPETEAVGNQITRLTRMSVSSLQDTLWSRSHSRDFAFARGDYLRNRVLVVGGIFIGLLPLWTLIDWLVLPAQSIHAALTARVVMLIVLLLTLFIAYKSKARLSLARISSGLLLATPAVFYALVLSTLTDSVSSLVGYSFIPYMLVAMLAIFPFTLVESAVLGMALLLLEAYALHTSGILLTAQGLQAIWLLSALLVISITANYFHLAVMLCLFREATHQPRTGLRNRGALRQTMEQIGIEESTAPRSLLVMD